VFAAADHRVRLCRHTIAPAPPRLCAATVEILGWPPERESLLSVRAATLRKRELRRSLRRVHLAHLAQVAKVAARDEPDLAQKFLLRPDAPAGGEVRPAV
jgi:hypothetical protein